MSDIILISKVGLCETIKCTICKNPNQTDRGCDGACQYDKELHAKIVEAVEGIAEQRPHGEWKQVGEMTYKCTKCGWIKKTGLMPYCENCGSDNRKERGVGK